MSQTEPCYTLTLHGRLTMDVAEKLEALLREQRHGIDLLLQEASLNLRKHDCFGAAEQIVDALTIMGLFVEQPA